MTKRNRQSIEHRTDAIDSRRRQVILAAVAGSGAAMLGGLAWARGDGAADTAATTQPTTVRIVVFDDHGERLGTRELARVVKSAAEWQEQLSSQAYRITRESATEPPYSGDHVAQPDTPGIYRCVCCDTALYDAATQFHSGTGWPSFWQPIAEQNVREAVDASLGMRRTEIKCTRCDAHLGHVFQDGPQPTGLRYCMNSAALDFNANASA